MGNQNCGACRRIGIPIARRESHRENSQRRTILQHWALLLFLGDFDNAYRFLAEAGVEDEKSGRGSRFKILLGDHGLSEQVLITPLEGILFPRWSASYVAVTSTNLDKPEFAALLGSLAARPTDAFQTMIALHRFRRSLFGFENEATQHIRVRAIAELIVVLESTLKRQFHPTDKMLSDLLEQLLQANPKALAAFKGSGQPSKPVHMVM